MIVAEAAKSKARCPSLAEAALRPGQPTFGGGGTVEEKRGEAPPRVSAAAPRCDGGACRIRGSGAS